MTIKTETVQELVNRVAAEAEAYEAVQDQDADYPPGTKFSRPNRRDRVLQVRLSDAEMASVEAAAAERGVAVSVVARERLLARPAGDAAVRLRAVVAELQELAESV